VLFTAAGVKTIDLDLCKFSAQPRPAQMANGFADPCAEPAGRRKRRRRGRRAGYRQAPRAGKGMTVTAVTSGDQALTWLHENDRVRITLPRAFAAGDTFSFECQLSRRACHGHPDCRQQIWRPRLGGEPLAEQGTQLPRGRSTIRR
jgi:hypothetical protein